MPQNNKLLNLTTKPMIQQCKHSLKTVKSATLFIINAPVHDGNTSIRKLSFFNIEIYILISTRLIRALM